MQINAHMCCKLESAEVRKEKPLTSYPEESQSHLAAIEKHSSPQSCDVTLLLGAIFMQEENVAAHLQQDVVRSLMDVRQLSS